ncbi:hypothetical protein HYC85_004255 [Camellia sinensis]|uniref:D-isomer specific 2-hydroxyacid dehydrogenase NAD-binding domain-containing protein n=1 Tax=Camellia sinensis TaxID=4442 RepID=A0A7J7HW12_CAMSI|nr:hypothetical protein HYC85_004255 [Camellia sinensis]
MIEAINSERRVTKTIKALISARIVASLFSGKSVGIIGLGRIGSAIAKRAEAFGCPISYYSRSQKPNSKYKYYPSGIELASNCHILVVSCALNKETRHIINRGVINALGPKGVIINIGRGPHVDEPELVSALVQGRLGGAGLDVFEHEPEIPGELFGLDNVVFTPHIGSGTMETRKAMVDLVIANLEAHFLSKPLLTPVVIVSKTGQICHIRGNFLYYGSISHFLASNAGPVSISEPIQGEEIIKKEEEEEEDERLMFITAWVRPDPLMFLDSGSGNHVCVSLGLLERSFLRSSLL